jgi:hypothetical protein
LSSPFGPRVVLTVSATAITALEFDSRALSSIFSAIGRQTPKFGLDMPVYIAPARIKIKIFQFHKISDCSRASKRKRKKEKRREEEE